jgi:hypothetical protein
MNKRIYILLSILTLFLMACEERLIIDTIDQEADKLFVECEISTSRRIEASLYTIGNFNQLNKLSYPQDAVLRLVGTGDNDYPFIYDSEKKIYYVDSIRHMATANHEYNLIAYLKGKEDNKLESERIQIPNAQNLSVSKPSHKLSKTANGLNKMNLSFQASAPAEINNEKLFYRIIMYRKLYENAIYTGKNELLNFEGNSEIPLAFTPSADGSVLFDPSRFKNNTFTLNFSTNSFKAGEKIETVYYALETVTEDTYRYLVVKEKQAYASQNGISDPVINYTNMVNGYGFIGGSSKAVDSLVIK